MSAPAGACLRCGDSGWVTFVDPDGESASETTCPAGCPTGAQPLDEEIGREMNQEMPF